MFWLLLTILLDMLWHTLVKLKQHKLQLEYFGIISFAIMDSQRNSFQTKEGILSLIW